jgi:thymidylate kinase
VQILQHEYCAKYFILGRIRDNHIEYLIPDICADYVRDGRVLINSEDLLKEREFYEGFYKCNPLIEAEYIFFKRCLKKSWEKSHLNDFVKIYEANPQALNVRLKKYVTPHLFKDFISAVEQNDLDNINQLSNRLRKSILRKTFLANPLKFFSYSIKNSFRILKRIKQPTGLIIAVIGIDGSGKSAIINELSNTLAPAFRRKAKYHWKPTFKPVSSNNIVVSEPHKHPPRSFIVSLLKLLFYVCQYIIVHYSRVYWQKVKSTLVIYDRYYYDMLVDQKRFRMKLPPKVIRFFTPCIPKPDLIFLLKTNADIAYKRKKELSLGELERQNNEFLALKELFKKQFYVIDNNGDIEKSVNEINSIIFDYLEERVIK